MRRKVITVIVVVVILSVIYLWVRQILESLGVEDRLRQANLKVEELKREQRELKKRLEEVNSVQYIETQARNKLNLARENEAVVIIPEVLVKKILEESQPQLEIKLPNWQGWLRLFIN